MLIATNFTLVYRAVYPQQTVAGLWLSSDANVKIQALAKF